jgi:AcrR family transcriptional regulator
MARTKGSDGKKTEAAIRARALELIVRHGFEALTMRQLAAAVGIQAGALYRYFPDKQSLLFSLMQRHMSDTLAVTQAAPSGADHSARLVQFARLHILHHVAMRNSAHVVNNELRSLSRENFAAILKQRSMYEKKLRTILKEGAEAGAFAPADSTLTAAAMIAMLNEVCVWFREGGTHSLEQVAEIYARMSLKMVNPAL